jgi:ABC-type multidrug transport system fused ATPase/permease subunit
MLSAREKKVFYVSWFFMLASGVVQVFGIVSIMPFISVVSNQEMIHENQYLQWTYNFFNFNNNKEFIIFLGIAVVAITLFANLIIAVTRWIETKLLTYIGTRLQSNLLEHYLYKPYTFFLQRNSATLAKTLLGETNQAINGVLLAGIEMVNMGFVSLMVVILLVVIDPSLALISFAVLGLLFGGVSYFVRKKLQVIGKKRVKANGDRFKSAQESLSGIKDIKLMGKEQAYLYYFSRSVKSLLRYNEYGRIYQQIPPIIMEMVVISGLMALVLYFIMARGGIMEALPIITLFAFAAYRLKPSLQGFFQKWATVKYNTAALENIIEDLEADEDLTERNFNDGIRLSLKNMICVKNLNFSYPNSANPALKYINLKITANTSVAFVGPSGSGKTTLVDVIMGLLRRDSGKIVVDDMAVEGDGWRKWQNNIGYIPQHIYLTDDSIAANIAFGIRQKDINYEQVKTAARAAHLDGFIEGLPEGYETIVGERGVRLSGGQRQRIGIARSLYHDPDVLVMDEATSALDTRTENAVMEAIYNLSGTKTILIIAHRLSTVQKCDKIFVLNEGKLVEEGTYDELLMNEEFFAKHLAPESIS